MPSENPSPELVILDCDGVLVDSEPISNGVLARLLGEEGLSMTLAQARAAFQGMLLSEVREDAERRLGRALPAGWIEHYEREREVAFRAELGPVPGAHELVRELRAAGVSYCVASQGKLEKSETTLGLTGLIDLFPEGVLFSAYSVPRGKPHPDLFLHAAATMGFPPERCAVIEDTPSGVTAGVGAGMRVLGYCADSDAAALRAAGAELIGSLREAPALLGLGGSD